MKKSLSLLLVLSMLLALTACVGAGNGAPAPTEAPTAEPTQAPTPEPTAEPTPEPTEEPKEELEELNQLFGTYDPEAYCYTNEFFGFGWQGNRSWEVTDEEQMAALNGFVKDTLAEANAEEKLRSGGEILCFFALRDGGNRNINVTVDRVKLSVGEILSEQSFLESQVKQMLPYLEAAWGVTDLVPEVFSTSFAGQEHTVAKLNGLLQGVDFYEAMVYVRKGDYIAMVTATSYREDETDVLLSRFYDLEQGPDPSLLAEASSEPTEEHEEKAESIMGVYDEASFVYTNKLMGLSCQLDEDWTVLDQKQIANFMGFVGELMNEEEAEMQLDSGGAVTPFYALTAGGLVTINMNIQDLGLVYGRILDEETYAELLSEEGVPALKAALGLADVTAEISTIQFAGGEHAAVFIHAASGEIEFYEVLVCVKNDRYMANITVASYFVDLTGDVLAMFSGL